LSDWKIHMAGQVSFTPGIGLIQIKVNQDHA